MSKRKDTQKKKNEEEEEEEERNIAQGLSHGLNYARGLFGPNFL